MESDSEDRWRNFSTPSKWHIASKAGAIQWHTWCGKTFLSPPLAGDEPIADKTCLYCRRMLHGPKRRQKKAVVTTQEAEEA